MKDAGIKEGTIRNRYKELERGPSILNLPIEETGRGFKVLGMAKEQRHQENAGLQALAILVLATLLSGCISLGDMNGFVEEREILKDPSYLPEKGPPFELIEANITLYPDGTVKYSGLRETLTEYHAKQNAFAEIAPFYACIDLKGFGDGDLLCPDTFKSFNKTEERKLAFALERDYGAFNSMPKGIRNFPITYLLLNNKTGGSLAMLGHRTFPSETELFEIGKSPKTIEKVGKFRRDFSFSAKFPRPDGLMCVSTALTKSRLSRFIISTEGSFVRANYSVESSSITVRDFGNGFLFEHSGEEKSNDAVEISACFSPVKN